MFNHYKVINIIHLFSMINIADVGMNLRFISIIMGLLSNLMAPIILMCSIAESVTLR